MHNSAQCNPGQVLSSGHFRQEGDGCRRQGEWAPLRAGYGTVPRKAPTVVPAHLAGSRVFYFPFPRLPAEPDYVPKDRNCGLGCIYKFGRTEKINRSSSRNWAGGCGTVPPGPGTGKTSDSPSPWWSRLCGGCCVGCR